MNLFKMVGWYANYGWVRGDGKAVRKGVFEARVLFWLLLCLWAMAMAMAIYAYVYLMYISTSFPVMCAPDSLRDNPILPFDLFSLFFLFFFVVKKDKFIITSHGNIVARNKITHTNNSNFNCITNITVKRSIRHLIKVMFWKYLLVGTPQASVFRLQCWILM